MTTFEVGRTYTHGWAGDSEMFTSWTVLKRTKATITITNGRKTKTCRISKPLSECCKSEAIYPFGQYSMCPILTADKLTA